MSTTNPAACAEPTIDQTVADATGVDRVPVEQGGSIDFRPSPEQGDTLANLQAAVDGDGFAVVHDADQLMNMLVGEWCKRFRETPQAAMFHMVSILNRLRTASFV